MPVRRKSNSKSELYRKNEETRSQPIYIYYTERDLFLYTSLPHSPSRAHLLRLLHPQEFVEWLESVAGLLDADTYRLWLRELQLASLDVPEFQSWISPRNLAAHRSHRPGPNGLRSLHADSMALASGAFPGSIVGGGGGGQAKNHLDVSSCENLLHSPCRVPYTRYLLDALSAGYVPSHFRLSDSALRYLSDSGRPRKSFVCSCARAEIAVVALLSSSQFAQARVHIVVCWGNGLFGYIRGLAFHALQCCHV